MTKPMSQMTKAELAEYAKQPSDMTIIGGKMIKHDRRRASVGDNSIKAIADSIVQAAQDMQLATFDKAFFIGKQLSALEELARDPNCGAEGKSWKVRYKSIQDEHILYRASKRDMKMDKSTLRRYKQAHGLYAPYIDDLRGKVDFTNLVQLMPAKFNELRPGILDDIINGQPIDMAEIKASVAKPKAKPAPVNINKMAQDLEKQLDREQLIKLAQKLLEDMKDA